MAIEDQREQAAGLLAGHDKPQLDIDIEDRAAAGLAPVEANGSAPPKHVGVGSEYSVPARVKFTWLGVYFFFSLTLTLYNKFVLGKVGLCGVSLCALFWQRAVFPRKPATTATAAAVPLYTLGTTLTHATSFTSHGCSPVCTPHLHPLAPMA